MCNLRNRFYLLAWAGLVISISTHSTIRADWSQFQGDAAHSGYTPGIFTPAGFSKVWSFSNAEGSALIDRAVAMDGQRLFATVQTGYVFGGTFRVSAFDLKTGGLLWHSDLAGSSPYGVTAPSISDNCVYVHHFGHSGSSGSTYPTDYPAMVGIDIHSGARQFFTTHSGQWSSGGRPTVVGDQVISPGGYYGGLDAYNATSGALSWSRSMPQQYGWTPAVSGNLALVYMGAASASPGPMAGTFYAIDRSTGSTVFQISHPQSSYSFYGRLQNVSVGGQNDALALTPGDGNPVLVSFDLISRTIRWQVDGAWSSNMAIHNGLIAIAEGSQLTMLDEATGQRLWGWAGSAGADFNQNVILTDNTAFVSTVNSTFAIDLESHETVWSVNEGGQLAMSNGILAISGANWTSVYAVVPEPASILGILTLLLFPRSRSVAKNLDQTLM